MDRDDTNIKLFTFGMNDEYGRLILIKIPAESHSEATQKIREMIPDRYFDDGLWLNDVEPY